MAAFETVAEYIAEARVLLQDTDTDVLRYSDAELITALNLAILEALRLRADLFIGRMDNPPKYTTTGQTVDMDPRYRSALIYYIAGRAQLRDQEKAQDSRATVLMNKFVAQMLTITS